MSKRYMALRAIRFGLALSICAWPWTAVQAADAAAGDTAPSTAQIDQALWCIADKRIVPRSGVGDRTALLLPGANNTGSGVWAWSYAAQLPADGIRACTLDFPHRNTGDLQISAQYLVGAVKRLNQRYPQTHLTVVAHSLGNLSALWAFHSQPDFMAANVEAYVAIGAPFKGVPSFLAKDCSASSPCQPYQWQISPGSNFLREANATPLPGPVRYVSVVSVNDPLFGGQWPFYSSFPSGTVARQIGIQRLCMTGQVVSIGHVQELAVASIYRLTRDVILDQPYSDLSDVSCTTDGYAHLEPRGLQWTDDDGGKPSHLGDAPEVRQEPPLPH